MTEAEDLNPRLAATTDVIATRLNGLLTRVDALPPDTPGAEELRADAESLRPMVGVLEQMGVDPDNPVPMTQILPAAVVPAAGLAPIVRGDGEPMPAPAGTRHER